MLGARSLCVQKQLIFPILGSTKKETASHSFLCDCCCGDSIHQLHFISQQHSLAQVQLPPQDRAKFLFAAAAAADLLLFFSPSQQLTPQRHSTATQHPGWTVRAGGAGRAGL